MTKFTIASFCDPIVTKNDNNDVYMIVHVAYHIQGISFTAIVNPLVQNNWPLQGPQAKKPMYKRFLANLHMGDSSGHFWIKTICNQFGRTY